MRKYFLFNHLVDRRFLITRHLCLRCESEKRNQGLAILNQNELKGLNILVLAKII